MNKLFLLFSILCVVVTTNTLKIDGETNKNVAKEDQTLSEASNVVATNPTETTIAKNPVVTMTMNDGKVIKMELYPNIAPNTVNNFIYLINQNFYDGIVFHRVIPGFIAQAGDSDGSGSGGPGYCIKGEFSENNFKNDLHHDLGVVSMARAPSYPNSAGSQFFIVMGDDQYDSLDGKYCAFGKVIEGIDNVYDIVNSPVKNSSVKLNEAYSKLFADEELTTDETALIQAYKAGEVFDRPVNPPKIKTMTVETFGVTYPEPEKVAK